MTSANAVRSTDFQMVQLHVAVPGATVASAEPRVQQLSAGRMNQQRIPRHTADKLCAHYYCAAMCVDIPCLSQA